MKALFHYSLALALLAGCTSGPSQAPSMSPAYNLPASQNADETSLAFGQLVDRYEAPTRLDWQQPDKVLALMGELRGKTIADIGAGTGFFSFRLARAGADVLAIDIDPRFLQFIEQRRREWPDSIAARITLRQATLALPPLTPSEADGVLLVNTYAYIERRPTYFNQVLQGIKPDGWLLVVEYKEGTLPVGPAAEDKITSQQIVAELESAGFRKVTVQRNLLPYQNLYWAYP